MIRASHALVPALIGCALLAAPAARAQDLVEDEAFARALLRKGLLDLAERAFRLLGENRADGETAARGRLGLIEVLAARAARESDPAAKKALYDEAVSRYRGFLATREDPEALFGLGGLLRAKGEDFQREWERSGDGKDALALGAEARSAFREAASLFKRVLEADRERSLDPEEGSEEQKDRRRNAFYQWADLLLLEALSWPPGGDPRREGLRAADAAFEAFIWEYEGYAQAYLAFIQRARCAIEAGEGGRALDQLRVVLDLPASAEDPPAQRRLRDRLRIMAIHRTIEALVRSERFDAAVETAAAFEVEYPRAAQEGSPDPLAARAALLEKAKALMGMGETARAAQTVMDVARLGGAARDWGMALLASWGLERDPRVGIEVLLLRAEALSRSRDLDASVDAYEEALRRLETPEQRRSHACRIWEAIGDAYVAQERIYAAGLAFEEGEAAARPFLEGRSRSVLEDGPSRALYDGAARCAYRAYRAFKAVLGDRGNLQAYTGLAARVEALRGTLLERYAEGSYTSGGVVFGAGQDRLREGRALEAVRAFEEVEEGSEFYESARIAIAQAMVKRAEELRRQAGEGDPGAVEAALARARRELQAVRQRTGEGRGAGKGDRRAYKIATYLLGKVCIESAEWSDAAAVLEAFEDLKGGEGDLTLPAVYLRFKARMGLLDDDGAERDLKVCEAHDPGSSAGKPSPIVLAAYRDLGAYFEKRAQGWPASDPQGRAAAEGRSFSYFERWLDGALGSGREPGGDPQVLELLEALGARFYRGGRMAAALRCYEALVACGDSLEDDRRKRARAALGQCYFASGRYAEALPLVQELHLQDPTEANGERLAVAQLRTGEIRLAEGDAQGAHRAFDEALRLYDRLLERTEPGRRSFWERKLAVWTILFHKGEYDSVVAQVTNASLLYPTMGGPDLRGKAIGLQQKAKALAGARAGGPGDPGRGSEDGGGEESGK